MLVIIWTSFPLWAPIWIITYIIVIPLIFLLVIETYVDLLFDSYFELLLYTSGLNPKKLEYFNLDLGGGGWLSPSWNTTPSKNSYQKFYGGW